MEVQFTQILEEELYIYQNTNWIVALKDSSGRIKSLYLFASIDFVRKLPNVLSAYIIQAST